MGRLADTLDALIMDTNGWTPGSSTDVDRSWRDQNRNPIRARLLDRPAAETTLEGWRSRSARETAAGGGVVLSFDEARLDGCPAFRGLHPLSCVRQRWLLDQARLGPELKRLALHWV